jgi:hypothetical protein
MSENVRECIDDEGDGGSCQERFLYVWLFIMEERRRRNEGLLGRESKKKQQDGKGEVECCMEMRVSSVFSVTVVLVVLL